MFAMRVPKRKRSDSDISTASSSTILSPSRTHSIDTSHVPPILYQQTLRDGTSSCLSSRTRKRFRDNRPSEATVHEHTLSILYSAQRNPQPSQAQQIRIARPATPSELTQQPSLHSFWALPSQPSSSSSSRESTYYPSSIAMCEASNCEDCDAALASAEGDAMDIDMDVDVYCGTSSYICPGCGKQVCHQCAVSNLGSERCCLICAGERTWVGGIGWVKQD